jgi:hypothetical protein
VGLNTGLDYGKLCFYFKRVAWGPGAPEGSRSGEGVRGLISSLDTTTPGSSGTRPVAQNPALMFSDEKVPWYTVVNAARNGSLSMWLMWLFARVPTSLVGWLVGIDFRPKDGD